MSFLDVTVTNNRSGSYDFKIHRKDAITNVQLKPSSSIDPRLFQGVFKGFLVRALRICSTQYLEDEIQFLVDVFVENGHDRRMLEKIVETYRTPRDSSRTITHANIIKIPWIPVLGPKLRKIYRKQGLKVVFTSSSSLKNILCNHKSKLPPNSHPGVYKVDCKCGQIAYVGETKKRISSRIKEHEKDVCKGRWSNSGLAEHTQTCENEFDFENACTLAIEPDYRRRKIREALEIRLQGIAPIANRDRGNIMKSESWNAILLKLNKKL